MAKRRKEWEETEAGKKFETRKARQKFFIVWLVVMLIIAISMWDLLIGDFWAALGMLFVGTLLAIVINSFIEF